MRFGRAFMTAAALAPIAVASMAQRASADERAVSNTQDFTFTYRGEPLTCTVVGENGWDYADNNAGQIIINYRTALVDDEHRCYEAWIGGGAGVTWWRPGETDGDTTSSGSSATEITGSAYLSNFERAETVHDVAFACETTSPYCSLQFWTPVRYPK